MDNNVLTVGSYNVRTSGKNGMVDKYRGLNWIPRMPRVAEVIQSNAFDLLGTQEGYPWQIQDLKANTGLIPFGEPREGDGTGESSSIFYRPERILLHDTGTFWLSETPDVPSFGWGATCLRVATWGLLEDKRTGKQFIMYNCHLDHRSKEAMINGVKVILKHIAEHASGLPVILTGDFNVRPDSETYAAATSVLKDARFLSEQPPQGPQNYTYQAFQDGNEPDFPGAVIDYVFVSEGVRVCSFRVDTTKPHNRFASDHCPVIAQVVLA
ncbi:MAG: endonuclease/exonuclease/phosphatase family protein [Victivallales bacterium]|nr:endonuclease/exonuclease/phosphatase family protein [Victivallales bacterium]